MQNPMTKWMLLVMATVALMTPWPSQAALIARQTTWTDAQVLTHSALNTEFDEVFDEVNGNLNAANLAATLTMADGDFLDFSASNASSTTDGLRLPQATSCTSATADGQLCWDTDDNLLYLGDGSAARSQTLVTNAVNFTRTAVAGSGAQTVAHGLGVDPIFFVVMCEDAADDAAWGLADDDDDESQMNEAAAAASAAFSSATTVVVSVNDGGGNAMNLAYTSDDATNLTLTWTKTASGVDVSCVGLVGG